MFKTVEAKLRRRINSRIKRDTSNVNDAVSGRGRHNIFSRNYKKKLNILDLTKNIIFLYNSMVAKDPNSRFHLSIYRTLTCIYACLLQWSFS